MMKTRYQPQIGKYSFRFEFTISTIIYERPFSKILWAGEDLNLRRLTPTGLQPVPFGRSGTDPEVRILALAIQVPTH